MEEGERGRVELGQEVVRERAVVEAEERVVAKEAMGGSYRDNDQSIDVSSLLCRSSLEQ
jgi:hypothetical protein